MAKAPPNQLIVESFQSIVKSYLTIKSSFLVSVLLASKSRGVLNIVS